MERARDAELIRLADDGDERAFAALVERHRPRAVAVAWRLTRDPVAADEVVGESLVRLHRALPTFRHDAALSTWFFRTVVNLCHDRARARAREQNRVSFDELPPLASTGPAPDAAALARERGRHMDDAVQALPLPMRQVVVLRYVSGLGYDEIANVLGCAPGTVASRIYRALRAIAALLAARGITEDSL